MANRLRHITHMRTGSCRSVMLLFLFRLGSFTAHHGAEEVHGGAQISDAGFAEFQLLGQFGISGGTQGIERTEAGSMRRSAAISATLATCSRPRPAALASL